MKISGRYVRQILLVFAFALTALQAFALDRSEAKAQGLIGESSSGYLEIVAKSTPELKALIKEINEKRKKKYQEIAKKNKIPLASVEKMGAQKAFKKTKPGHFVKKNGSWVKK